MHAVDSDSDKFIAGGRRKCKVCVQIIYWSKLVHLLNIPLWNNIPNLCKVACEILPCKQSFLSFMAFSVYEVVCVACLSRSWFVYV